MPGMDDDDVSEELAACYRTAYGHARAIVDAATYSLRGGGYWTMAGVPTEADAMIAAIVRRMGIGPKMGQRDVPAWVVRRAVEDVLEARPPAW